ncbi:MAG: hypothetical protein QOJ54_568, partial [Aliidongia sp.]|jgi:phage terminase small subunit|nr:hypothetical protein [Aliidongia sp.]
MAVVNRQALLMTKIASELGFSPVSRSRISLPTPPAPDPSDEFFA